MGHLSQLRPAPRAQGTSQGGGRKNAQWQTTQRPAVKCCLLDTRQLSCSRPHSSCVTYTAVSQNCSTDRHPHLQEELALLPDSCRGRTIPLYTPPTARIPGLRWMAYIHAHKGSTNWPECGVHDWGGLGGEEHEVQRRHVGEVMGGVEGWELKVEMIPFPCMHVWNSQE